MLSTLNQRLLRHCGSKLQSTLTCAASRHIFTSTLTTKLNHQFTQHFKHSTATASLHSLQQTRFTPQLHFPSTINPLISHSLTHSHHLSTLRSLHTKSNPHQQQHSQQLSSKHHQSHSHNEQQQSHSENENHSSSSNSSTSPFSPFSSVAIVVSSTGLFMIFDERLNNGLESKAFWTIMAINTLVFIAWQFPSLHPFMNRHFTVSWQALKERRYHTLLTSVFSHQDKLHFLFNSYVVWNFGHTVALILGEERFSAFYVCAGVFSSFCGVFFNRLTRFGSAVRIFRESRPSLGASGAICGLIALFLNMFPDSTMRLIFFPVAMDASQFLVFFAALESVGCVYNIINAKGSSFGHEAHLSGFLFGHLVWKWLLEDVDSLHDDIIRVKTRLMIEAHKKRLQREESIRQQQRFLYGDLDNDTHKTNRK